MKVALESTTKIVRVGAIETRIWEGYTAAGVPVIAFVARIACCEPERSAEFERDLQETRAPSAAVEAFPTRLAL